MGERKPAHPLDTSEIRDHASKWTLADDVGLLAHLEQFSDVVISKSEEAERSLRNLLTSVEETCTNFSNVSNQLLSLQNSQFLENRVYEEETPTEEASKLVKEEADPQKSSLECYKEAVTVGMQLLDSHFQQLEYVESSDSDEDLSSSGPALIWRPKQKYENSLPLLIGSAEWWADDNVGLGEFQENEDVASLDVESLEEQLPHESKPNRVRLSSSSSSLEAPALPLDIPPDGSMFDEESTSTQVTLEGSIQKNAANNSVQGGNDFTRELAAKLGSVANKPPTEKQEIDKKSEPSSPQVFTDKRKNDLFENTDDLFSSLGTTSNNLFDDVDSVPDHLFSTSRKGNLADQARHNSTSERTDDLFSDPLFRPATSIGSERGVKVLPNLPKQDLKKIESRANKESSSSPSKQGTVAGAPSNNLFGNVNDDDDLFSANPSSSTKSKGAISKTNTPKEDDLFSGSSSTKSKGAVSKTNTPKEDDLFAGTSDDLFGPSSSKPKPAIKFADDVKTPVSSSKAKENVFRSHTPARISDIDLFGDDTGDDLFAPQSKSKLDSKISARNESKSWQSSTPAEQGTPTAPEVLFDAPSLPDDGSLSIHEQNITDNETGDLGFADGSHNRVNPAGIEWFRPLLTSTRNVPESGYDSKQTDSRLNSTMPTNSTGNSNLPVNESGVSSIANRAVADSAKTVDGVNSTKNTSDTGHRSTEQRDVLDGDFSSTNRPVSLGSKSLGGDLFGDDSDDLFSSTKRITKDARHSKTSESDSPKLKNPIINDSTSSDSTDFVSAQSLKKPLEDALDIEGVPPPKEKGSVGKNKLFEDDDDTSLFSSAPATVSVSSSHSSLFDDATLTKSNLPGLFTKTALAKSTLFESVDDDYDLFAPQAPINDSTGVKSTMGKSVNPILAEAHDSDDLFKKNVSKASGDSSEIVAKPRVDNTSSLWEEEFNDSDDLFRKDTSRFSGDSRKVTAKIPVDIINTMSVEKADNSDDLYRKDAKKTSGDSRRTGTAKIPDGTISTLSAEEANNSDDLFRSDVPKTSGDKRNVIAQAPVDIANRLSGGEANDSDDLFKKEASNAGVIAKTRVDITSRPTLSKVEVNDSDDLFRKGALNTSGDNSTAIAPTPVDIAHRLTQEAHDSDELFKKDASNGGGNSTKVTAKTSTVITSILSEEDADPLRVPNKLVDDKGDADDYSGIFKKVGKLPKAATNDIFNKSDKNNLFPESPDTEDVFKSKTSSSSIKHPSPSKAMPHSLGEQERAKPLKPGQSDSHNLSNSGHSKSVTESTNSKPTITDDSVNLVSAHDTEKNDLKSTDITKTGLVTAISNESKVETKTKSGPLQGKLSLPSSEPDTDDIFKEISSNPSPPKTNKVGKLNIPSSLKINPATLMPGARPPKEMLNSAQSSVKVLNTESEPPKSIAAVPASPDRENSEDLVNKDNKINTLQHVVRDRAKISVKRRPQSRHARHMSIRASWAEESDDLRRVEDVPEPRVLTENIESEIERVTNQPNPVPDAVVKNSNSDDLFKEDLSKTSGDNSKINAKTRVDIASTLSEEEVNDSDDLFRKVDAPEPRVIDRKTEQVTIQSVNPAADIVVEKSSSEKDIPISVKQIPSQVVDSDDDLFGIKGGAKDTLGSNFTFGLEKKSKLKNYSLFGDDEDDDDLFGNSSVFPSKSTREIKTKNNPTEKASAHVSSRNSSTKLTRDSSKLSSENHIFSDPLGLMNDETK